MSFTRLEEDTNYNIVMSSSTNLENPKNYLKQ